MTKYLLLLAIVTAWVTKYGDQGYMASRNWVYSGAIACPRHIKLGTWVQIDGQTYVCEDHTALWVERRQGDTFDIYDPSPKEVLLKFGKQRKEVKIYGL